MATKGQKLLAAGATFIASEPIIQAFSHGPSGVGVGVIVGLVVGAAAYNAIDDIERLSGKEIPSLPTPTSTPGQPSLAYRLLNGKSVRETAPDTTKEVTGPKGVNQQPSDYISRSLKVSQDLAKIRKDIVPPGKSLEAKEAVKSEVVASPSQGKENIIPPGGYKPLDKIIPQEELSLDPRFPIPQDMAKIIQNGFKPNRSSILLMETTEGHATEKMSELGHVGMAGTTGAGKTNITRLITSQLLSCDAKVYMINPNYAPVKLNGNRLEDWRPIAARLQAPVAREAPEITALLNHFMKIFKDRQNREQLTPKRGSDIFLVIGEWPVVVEECPDAVDKVSRLLRQARQYGIHVLAEYQDALVKTIGGNSGTRANYGTVFFSGGDPTTAKALLRPPEGVKLNFTGLGKNGAVYLRSHSHHAITGRVPFFSNKALYMLLGHPEDPVTDELINEDDFYEDDEEFDEDEDNDETKKTAVLMDEFMEHDEEALKDIIARMPDRDQDTDIYQSGINRQLEIQKKPAVIKIGTDLTTKHDVTILEEQFDMLVSMRRSKLLKGYRPIMKILPITETHAKNLNKMILSELGEECEGECEGE